MLDLDAAGNPIGFAVLDLRERSVVRAVTGQNARESADVWRWRCARCVGSRS
jgi:hypothetical protein